METKKIVQKRKNEEKIPGKNHYTNNAAVRIQRNQAEKQRRDRLNSQIAQLATLVPPVVNATKPLDKVSILRLAASWMRINYSCLNAKRFKSAVVNYLDMHHSLVTNLDILEKSINGFIIATTFAGVVLMCSRYSEEYIGYQNIDILGHHISNFVLPKEKELLKKKMRNLISKYKKGSSNPRNVIRVRMQQRPLHRSNEIRYRKMSFSLSVHSGDEIPENAATLKKSLKSGRQKDFGENAIILIYAEPAQVEPDIDVQYLEQKDCYFTMHGPKGEIIFADHRISTMTGYMPRDVMGNSAYQYIHFSDVPIALFAQRAMFESSDGTGIITYRLRIRDSSYIYLQTKGQIRYKDSTKEVRQFICCNILLSDEDGSRELKKFQDRYAPQLKESKMALQEKKSPTESIMNANVDSYATRSHSTLKEHENIKQKSCLPVTSSSVFDAPMDMEEPNATTKNDSVNLHLSYSADRNHLLSSSSDIQSLNSAGSSPISSLANELSSDSLTLQIINFNKAFSPETLSCNTHYNSTLTNFDNISPVQYMSSSSDASVFYAEPVIQMRDDFPAIENPTSLISDLLLVPDACGAENSFFMSQKCTSSEDNCTQSHLQENVGSFDVSGRVKMVQDDLLISQDPLQNYTSVNYESLNIPDKTFSRFENGRENLSSRVSQNNFSTFNPTFAGDSQSALNMRVANAASKLNSDCSSQSYIDLSFLDNSVEDMALLSDLSDFYEDPLSFPKVHNLFQTETAISPSGTEMNCRNGVVNDTNCADDFGLFTQTSSDIHINDNAHSPDKFNASCFTSDNGHSVGANGIQRKNFNADFFQAREWQMKKAKIRSSVTKQKMNDGPTKDFGPFQTNAVVSNDGRVHKVPRKELNHPHHSFNSQSTLNHAQNEYRVIHDLENQARSSFCPSLPESMLQNLQ